jgi:hypothetical protein
MFWQGWHLLAVDFLRKLNMLIMITLSLAKTLFVSCGPSLEVEDADLHWLWTFLGS